MAGRRAGPAGRGRGRLGQHDGAAAGSKRKAPDVLDTVPTIANAKPRQAAAQQTTKSLKSSFQQQVNGHTKECNRC